MTRVNPRGKSVAQDLPPETAGLSARACALWDAVLEEFELAPAELQLLRSALESLDRADAASARLREEGLTVTDRYGGIRPHPCCDIESKNRALFARAIAQLGVKATTGHTARPGAKPGPRAA